MADNVKIKIRRTKLNINNSTLNSDDNNLDFGEPLFINNSSGKYLVIGSNENNSDTSVSQEVVARLLPKDTANSVVYEDGSTGVLKRVGNDVTVQPMTDATRVHYQDNTNVKQAIDNKVDIVGSTNPLALGYDGTDVYVEV